MRSIEIYTPYIKKEEFFKKGTMNIDSFMINHHGTFENFFGRYTCRVVWDSVELYGSKFRGKGCIEIVDTIRSRVVPALFYPPQKISYEF
jgi:hypothetical protein